MPTYTESAIVDRGEDIIHRLKKFSYSLREIYTRDFPKELWERYTKEFELGDLAYKIMDDYVLESIGQISERDDLGEGPRTVVEAFKRAIHYYQTTGKRYSPIAFIDDIYNGRITFQAHTNKLKNVLNKHIHSAIIDTDEKRRAIMLLTAFPRGCRVEIQKYYGLYDVINELSKVGHGDIMIYVAEGYTLLGLQEGKGPEDIIDKIIYDFWRTYDESDAIYRACSAFVHELIPAVFKKRIGSALVGWKYKEQHEIWGYSVEAEGTFNPHYPNRWLKLRVIREETNLEFDENFDFQFDFILEMCDDEGRIEVVNDRYVIFHLCLKYRPQLDLPDDLKKLQEYVNPALVTPLLMLSLIDYFEEWDKRYHIPEGNKSEVDFLKERLLNYTILWLFNENLAKSFGIEKVGIGRMCVEDVFNKLCKMVYPEYRTLIVSNRYENPLKDYINALLTLSLKQRRGHAEIVGTKEEIAELFGTRSVAAFENRLRSDFKDLMEEKTWEGKGKESKCSIVLKLHPLEKKILEQLRKSKTASIEELMKVSRNLGYLDEELKWGLKLLEARAYIDFDDPSNPTVVRLIMTRTKDDVLDVLTTLEEAISRISHVLSLEEIKNKIRELKEQLGEISEDDEEELDELLRVSIDLKSKLENKVNESLSETKQKLNNTLLELTRYKTQLKQDKSLDKEILGQVGFVQHLNEARQRLAKVRDSILKDIEKLEEKLKDSINKTFTDFMDGLLILYDEFESSKEELKSTKEKIEKYKSGVDFLNKWKMLLQRADGLFNNLRYTPDLKEEFNNVIYEIQEHLTKHKIDGLKDYEVFERKIDEIEKELRERQRISHDQFTKVKEDYQKLLRTIDITDYLKSRFTYGEDEESYKDLFSEVKERIESKLNNLKELIEEINIDLLKCRYIYGLDVSNFSERLSSIMDRIDTLYKGLSLDTIKNIETFKDYLNSVKELVDDINSLKADIRGLIHTTDEMLSDDELMILKFFENKDELDITDVFAQLKLKDGTFDLQRMMNALLSLYRKNRVVIRVRKRG